MKRLQDKVAIITGGGTGIGYETAKLFAAEGAKVVIVGRRRNVLDQVVEEITAAGGTAVAMEGSVSDVATAQRVCQETADQFGQIDILVNSAGIGDYTRPITAVTDEFWHKITSINEDGVFFFCREVLKYMQKVGKGAIVNVSSVGGVFFNSGLAYAASKSAVIAMTHNMGIQFAGTDIRINAVCPGATSTPMQDDMRDKSQMCAEDQDMRVKTGRHFNTTIKPCEAIDQANTILFLASEEARAIQGQYIVVDNGAWL